MIYSIIQLKYICMCIKISNIKFYRFTPHFPFQKACEFYSIARIDLYLNSQQNIVWVINFCSNLYIAFRGYRHLNPNWFVSMVPAKSLSCAPRFFASYSHPSRNSHSVWEMPTVVLYTSVSKYWSKAGHPHSVCVLFIGHFERPTVNVLIDPKIRGLFQCKHWRNTLCFE